MKKISMILNVPEEKDKAFYLPDIVAALKQQSNINKHLLKKIRTSKKEELKIKGFISNSGMEYTVDQLTEILVWHEERQTREVKFAEKEPRMIKHKAIKQIKSLIVNPAPEMRNKEQWRLDRIVEILKEEDLWED